MTDLLVPSSWTVVQARDAAPELRSRAEGVEYDFVEHFQALCSHLDELYGGDGFTWLLDPVSRRAVAERIGQLRQAGDATRLTQPVNSAFTLSQGREVAAAAAPVDDWKGELGRALQGVYGYLDELYGGPGRFDELLNSAERPQVAELIRTLPRP